MIIKLNNVQNRYLKRFLEHIVYFILVSLLIPGFFYIALVLVVPSVVEVYSVEYYIHFFNAMFFLFNIVGNLIYGVFTDTSIRGMLLKPVTHEDWSYCEECQCFRPPRAWHCDLCNICILKRDHHCSYFACCVGYYNHRYFFFFTVYVFFATTYLLFYYIKFVVKYVSWNNGLAIAKFIFPLASLVFDFSEETFYLLFALVNLVVVLFTGYLSYFHFKHILKGTTVPELRHNKRKYDKGWKRNVREVFGRRWYLAWFLPFIQSPLPGDGIHWETKDRTK